MVPQAPDLTVRSRRVVTPEGVRAAAVVVEKGRIAAVLDLASARPAGAVVDRGDLVVLPGLVDAHVHINEPGRTEWEGFATATRAAAAGGVTTLVDMPLNSIPATTSVAALEAKRAAARDRLDVDCALLGRRRARQHRGAGAAGRRRGRRLQGLPRALGSGRVPARGRSTTSARRCRSWPRAAVPLLVHAELASPVATRAGDPRRYATYLASRPASWENDAIRLLVRLCRETGCAVHIVHLSSAEALAPAGRGPGARVCPSRSRPAPTTSSSPPRTCPTGRTDFKCSPPIRERANRERLWEGLADRDHRHGRLRPLAVHSRS